MSKRRGGRNPGCGCGSGCGGFLVVLLLGGALSLFGATFGAGLSARIPFTAANVTMAASIGAKERTVDALPDYTRGRLGGNQDVINNSTTLTIGPAQGAGLFVIGDQEGAPVVDVRLTFLR